jgi:asparagine synthase (glutamine-hydrolysing)
MSSFFGLFNLSLEPIAQERLEAMYHKMSYWHPDRHSIWHQKHIGLGQLMLCITPESLKEHLPYSDGGLAITANARIDNREALAKSLGIESPIDSIPDSKLILKAYQKWGDDCAAHLIGEFAFAIWDEANKSLYCAKDAFGTRPLYYSQAKDHFIFSSEIRGIFASELVKKELNDIMLAVHLIGFKGEKVQTTYKGVSILPAAHWLKVTPDGITKKRYWDIDLSRKVQYSTNTQYEEAFRELLINAIKVRTRSAYPVGCLLSGGLDSTSIAGVALKQSMSPPLHLYSWAHPLEENQHDDRFYIDKFLQFHKEADFKHQYLSGLEGYFKLIPEFKQFFDEPFRDIEHYTRFQSYQEGKSDNIRVLLSGVGGDELTSNFAYEYFVNLLFNFRWLRASKELHRTSLITGNTVKNLVNNFMVKPTFQMLKGRASWGKGNPQCGKGYFEKQRNHIYINPSFLKEVGLKQFIEQHETNTILHNPLKEPLKKRLYQNLNDGSLEISFNQRYHASLAFRTQYTYPLLDRDLVEFCMALPIDQFYQNGKSRSLIRRSMADYVPENILQRTSKFATSPNMKQRVKSELEWLTQEKIKNWEDNHFISQVIDLEKLKNELNRFKVTSTKLNSHIVRTIYMAFFLECVVNP